MYLFGSASDAPRAARCKAISTHPPNAAMCRAVFPVSVSCASSARLLSESMPRSLSMGKGSGTPPCKERCKLNNIYIYIYTYIYIYKLEAAVSRGLFARTEPTASSRLSPYFCFTLFLPFLELRINRKPFPLTPCLFVFLSFFSSRLPRRVDSSRGQSPATSSCWWSCCRPRGMWWL